jgi:hypothetical protein
VLERVVNEEQRQASLLSKAREAELEAEKAKSSEAKESWLRIAQNYRALAKTP